MPFYAIYMPFFGTCSPFFNCITSIINKHVYCSHFKPKIKYLAPSVAEIQYYMPFYAFFSNFHRFECVFLRCAATADCSVWLISSVMYYSVTYMYTCKIKILFTMILLKIRPKIVKNGHFRLFSTFLGIGPEAPSHCRWLYMANILSNALGCVVYVCLIIKK